MSYVDFKKCSCRLVELGVNSPNSVHIENTLLTPRTTTKRPSLSHIPLSFTDISTVYRHTRGVDHALE